MQWLYSEISATTEKFFWDWFTADHLTVVFIGLAVGATLVAPLIETFWRRPKIKCLSVEDIGWYFRRSDDGERVTGVRIHAVVTIENSGHTPSDVTLAFESLQPHHIFRCDQEVFRLAEHSNPTALRVYFGLLSIGWLPTEGTNIKGRVVAIAGKNKSKIETEAIFTAKGW